MIYLSKPTCEVKGLFFFPVKLERLGWVKLSLSGGKPPLKSWLAFTQILCKTQSWVGREDVGLMWCYPIYLIHNPHSKACFKSLVIISVCYPSSTVGLQRHRDLGEGSATPARDWRAANTAGGELPESHTWKTWSLTCRPGDLLSSIGIWHQKYGFKWEK